MSQDQNLLVKENILFYLDLEYISPDQNSASFHACLWAATLSIYSAIYFVSWIVLHNFSSQHNLHDFNSSLYAFTLS